MSSEPPSLPARIFGSLFLLPFFVGTVWFSGLLVYSFFRMAATYAWEERDCTILSSRVEEHTEETGKFYSFQVLYSYTVGGWRYTGDVYRFDSSSSSDIGEARRLVDRYPAGSRALCYVNPRNPSSSMLRRPGFWVYLFFPFSVLIAAVTGFGLYGLWKPRGAEAVGARVNRAFSRMGPRGILTIFFGFFLAFGLGLASYFVPVFFKALEAKSWPARPCTILSSGVHIYPGDSESGPTYSVDVLYAYTADGRQYKSNRYQFLGNSVGDHEETERVVRSLPPQKRIPCYVNPEHPSESVLNRDIDGQYAFALVSTLFALIGFTGLFFVARSWVLERRKP